MFLPAIIELKKPKDNGPRRIMESIPELKMGIMTSILIANIEEEKKFDISLIRTLAKIIEVLPSLEI
jgi:hypothetical protein